MTRKPHISATSGDQKSPEVNFYSFNHNQIPNVAYATHYMPKITFILDISKNKWTGHLGNYIILMEKKSKSVFMAW